jgi:hypothetical protein
MKRGTGKEKRSKFVRTAIQDPGKAARELTEMAKGLENCKNTSDIIFALCEIFCVSERTIFRDLV